MLQLKKLVKGKTLLIFPYTLEDIELYIKTNIVSTILSKSKQNIQGLKILNNNETIADLMRTKHWDKMKTLIKDKRENGVNDSPSTMETIWVRFTTTA